MGSEMCIRDSLAASPPRCIAAPLYRQLAVPPPRCNAAQRCTAVSPPRCPAVSPPRCIAASHNRRSAVPLPRCIAVPLAASLSVHGSARKMSATKPRKHFTNPLRMLNNHNCRAQLISCICHFDQVNRNPAQKRRRPQHARQQKQLSATKLRISYTNPSEMINHRNCRAQSSPLLRTGEHIFDNKFIFPKSIRTAISR